MILRASMARNQSGGEAMLDTKDFTWRIPNFSKLKDEIYSDAFFAGGSRWRVLCFPKGNEVDFLSLYLDFDDGETMPAGWSKYVEFSITIVNQISGRLSRKFCSTHVFKEQEEDWGFTSFIGLDELHSRSKGFLVDDTLVIKARVTTEQELSISAGDPEVIEPESETESRGVPSTPPLSSNKVARTNTITSPCSSSVKLTSRNLIAELSTMASCGELTTSVDGIPGSNADDRWSGLVQQQRQILNNFFGMSLEAISQANSFDHIQQAVLKFAEHATDPFEKTVLKDLVSRLVEFKDSIPQSLTIVETSSDVEKSTVQATKDLEGRLVQRQKQLKFLESEVSRIEEEEMKVEAEIQRLGALRVKLVNEKNLTVGEMEVANREASKELGELKGKQLERKQARENKLRAKERLAQSNASWKLFKENLGL
ncbi:unnamed protein product [Linum trigynum]|uniref:MATH domain-containing protein n=1 Tax=Linum trigynum TaxID=586398 RepID=A0AAV2DGA2_9ROSI